MLEYEREKEESQASEPSMRITAKHSIFPGPRDSSGGGTHSVDW